MNRTILSGVLIFAGATLLILGIGVDWFSITLVILLAIIFFGRLREVRS